MTYTLENYIIDRIKINDKFTDFEINNYITKIN